jgi:hypothetical protein
VMDSGARRTTLDPSRATSLNAQPRQSEAFWPFRPSVAGSPHENGGTVYFVQLFNSHRSRLSVLGNFTLLDFLASHFFTS